jgi:hypothetical protein
VVADSLPENIWKCSTINLERGKNLNRIPGRRRMPDKMANALNILKQAILDDPEYAWAWHCNLAMSAYDEGLPRPAANRAAARFMKILFDIDMTKHEFFKDTQT